MKNKNIKKKYEMVKELFYNMDKDHVNESTSACAYYTILSFIPFIILLITLIQYTGISPSTLFEAISKIIPSSMNEIVLNIVQEVYSKSIGTISVSIIFTIWSAGKGLFALSKGLQFVYRTNDKDKASYFYLRIRVLFETVLFIILIVLGLVFLVFGNSLKIFIQSYFPEIGSYNIMSNILTEVSLVSLTFVIFLLVYKFMPKHKVTFKSQFKGAAIGAILLNVVSVIFSKYLYIFKGFSITYGSLTTLMLIMMWTYSCFYIFFLGAEINKLNR